MKRIIIVAVFGLVLSLSSEAKIIAKKDVRAAWLKLEQQCAHKEKLAEFDQLRCGTVFDGFVLLPRTIEIALSANPFVWLDEAGAVLDLDQDTDYYKINADYVGVTGPRSGEIWHYSAILEITRNSKPTADGGYQYQLRVAEDSDGGLLSFGDGKRWSFERAQDGWSSDYASGRQAIYSWYSTKLLW